MIRSLPSPIGNLLCFVHLLDLVTYLRPADLLDWLKKANSAQDVLTSESWVLEVSDSLGLLYKLADFMEDIDEVVAAYADARLALMDTVSAPDADHRSIPLSSDEYARLASTFMLLHIDDKSLQSQVAYRPRSRRSFIDTLPIWQVEQMNAAAEFLQLAGRRGGLIYNLIDAKYNSRSHLHDVSRFAWTYNTNGGLIWDGSAMSYENGYLTLDAQIAHSNGHVSAVPYILGTHQPYYDLHSPRSLFPRHLGTVLIMPTQGDDFCSSSSTPTNTPSIPHAPIPAPPAWTFLKSLSITADVSRSVYTDIFVELGLFFWDVDRLWQMGIGDVEDFGDVVDNMAAVQSRAFATIYDRSEWSNTWVAARTVEQRLIDWTRSGAECSFGEWMAWRGEGQFPLHRQ